MNPTGRLEDEGRTLVLRRRLPVPIDDVWASITESERLAGGSARGLATRRRVR